MKTDPLLSINELSRPYESDSWSICIFCNFHIVCFIDRPHTDYQLQKNDNLTLTLADNLYCLTPVSIIWRYKGHISLAYIVWCFTITNIGFVIQGKVFKNNNMRLISCNTRVHNINMVIMMFLVFWVKGSTWKQDASSSFSLSIQPRVVIENIFSLQTNQQLIATPNIRDDDDLRATCWFPFVISINKPCKLGVLAKKYNTVT